MTKTAPATPDSKFTPQTAEATLKGQVKIEGKIINVPAKGLGLKALAALDYLVNKCGGIARFERATPNNYVPVDLRGRIIVAGK